MMNFSSPPTPVEFTSEAADFLYGLFLSSPSPVFCASCGELAAGKMEHLKAKLLTDRTSGARSNTLQELSQMTQLVNALADYAMRNYPQGLVCPLDPAVNRYVKA